MGFFSSIGKVYKKVAAPVAGVLGTVLSGGNAAAGAAMAGVTDSIWNGGSSGSSGSDWQKSAYGDQMAFAREQFDFNKQYIQNQMQWRVEDAKKAGLHPMAALGLNGASFSGVSMPSIPNVQESTYDPVELGQSVAYAAAKAKTYKQQEQAFELSQTLAGEQIKGVQLDNELKGLEIMSLVSRLSQTGPAAPSLNNQEKTLIGGQNDSPFLDKPITSNGFLLDEKGRKVDIIPSGDVKSRTEDVFAVEWMPFIDSAKLNFKTKVLGEPFAGHWWHEDRGEFLPYPPKEKKNARQDNQNSYYHNSWRYR